MAGLRPHFLWGLPRTIKRPFCGQGGFMKILGIFLGLCMVLVALPALMTLGWLALALVAGGVALVWDNL